MKTKKSLKFKIISIVVILAVLVVGSVLVYSIIYRPTSTDPTKKAATSTATFNFDTSKAPGWFAGANIDGAVANASVTGKKLGTVTRIISQGTPEKPDGNCFVQYSYWANSSKNPDQALNEMISTNETNASLTLQSTNTSSYTMMTSASETPFQLHQYNLTGMPDEQMSRGVEYGFLKAGTGYIDIRGYCKTSDELQITTPVFSAVSFKE